MFKTPLSALAGLLALAGPSLAAEPPPSPPPLTWAGFYLGGQVGYGWGSDSGNVTGGFPLSPTIQTASTSTQTQGAIGGAHIGNNWQIQNFVIGLEGDVNGTTLSKMSTPLFNNLYFPYTQSPVQGTVRGRLGYALDRTLLYATGGLAYGWIHNDYNIFGSRSSFSTTKAGWTIGGGVEFAVNDNWSVRAEYRYTRFGYFSDGPIAYPTVSQSHSSTQNQLQVGFSYKWPPLAPAAVVAKY
ncbi:OmpA domain protein transmembrane region-containing protein [Methylocella silvestris BL2]|uniref:OmpA domain protein transmembrane region-containing protein n=1 Tax=Methylocella silvestris (strain DSM 15510 / CIP 108128 / LMG 27833 / NCIMB 13906 / BL2) TaxID=395965 RepID=B8EMC3_METSB|nr:outer membrane protein [Methylocella silvestris]ACK52051.1 OmpA domain protein transmembrane region-containing protein [Methylocella silvestris BL2]